MTISTKVDKRRQPLFKARHYISLLRDATDFKKKVYMEVIKIPKGSVRSYKWLAARIGKPHSCRAVGNALNKNPYPLIIPCHRIIKSDGTIGGFSKGVREKKRLLSKEGVVV